MTGKSFVALFSNLTPTLKMFVEFTSHTSAWCNVNGNQRILQRWFKCVILKKAWREKRNFLFTPFKQQDDVLFVVVPSIFFQLWGKAYHAKFIPSFPTIARLSNIVRNLCRGSQLSWTGNSITFRWPFFKFLHNYFRLFLSISLLMACTSPRQTKI